MRHTARVLAGGLVLFWLAAAMQIPQSAIPQPTAGGDVAAVDVAYRIDVNTADAATLELLPGVGPSVARYMIEERQRGGPFESVRDLERVHQIGPVTAERIGPWVRFGDAGP